MNFLLFLPNRHVGIRIKAAVISLIFQKSLTVDLSATKDGMGKLNNMISVDASVSAARRTPSHVMVLLRAIIFDHHHLL